MIEDELLENWWLNTLQEIAESDSWKSNIQETDLEENY